MSKIFNISKPRSGTQSLDLFLKSAGYKTMHWIGNYLEFDLNQFKNENEIIEFISPLEEHFDAFGDSPYTVLYKHFSIKYPDAKFIFIDRDFEDWYKSNVNFLKKHQNENKLLTNFGKICYSKYIEIDFNEDKILSKNEMYDFYNLHKKDLKEHFSGSENLLSVSLKDNNISKKISNFLNIKNNIEFPNIDFLRKM
jgi:hypothetical protein